MGLNFGVAETSAQQLQLTVTDLSSASAAIPDFQGGLVAVNQDYVSGQASIQKRDGITGQANPAYSLSKPVYTSLPVFIRLVPYRATHKTLMTQQTLSEVEALKA